MTKKDMIKGRYTIQEFIDLINQKKGKIEPKGVYNVVLRIYSPQNPLNTALLKLTGTGRLLLKKLSAEIRTIKDKQTVAFCYFEINQVMRG